MNNNMEKLYQEMIMEHNKNPENFKEMVGCSCHSHGHNTLCGDEYDVYVKLSDDNIIEDVSFFGSGCAISKASGSMLTQTVKGKLVDDALKLKDFFIDLLTKDGVCGFECRKELGKLKVFEGVKKYPVRVKCATLIWRTFEDAIKNEIKDN